MATYTVEITVPADADCEVAGESATIEVDESEYVLAAARSTGLWLPADCQQGWCVTCAAELVSGEVDQSAARRYYEEDEEAGLVLTCTATPRSDLQLVGCREDAMLAHRAEHDRPPGRTKW